MSLNNQEGSVGSSVSFSIIIHMAIIGLLIFSPQIKKLPIIESLISSRTSTDMSIEASVVGDQAEDVTVAYVEPEKSPIKAAKKTDQLKIEKKTNNTIKDEADTIPAIPKDKKAKSKVKKVIAKAATKPKNKLEDIKLKDDKKGFAADQAPKLVKNPNPPKEIDHSQNLDTNLTSETAERKSIGGSSELGDGPRDVKKLVQLKGNPKPSYPHEARLEKAEGTVVLKYLVTDSGDVEDIRVQKSSGSRDLDEEAINKIEQWRFEPGQAGETTHPVTFKLDGPSKQLPSRLRTLSEG